jgi:hypothetical protein
MGGERSAMIRQAQHPCDESACERATSLKPSEVTAIIGCARPKAGYQRVQLSLQSRRPAAVQFTLIANPVSIRDHSRR